MEGNAIQPVFCISCGLPAAGKYCSGCGQAQVVRRITVQDLFHDIFHFFTHLDKGFGYTLKRLVTTPGHMQREYIDGNRSRYQKPFSMFFICASAAAVLRYWIIEILMKYYNSGDIQEANFFHQYMVFSQIAVMPLFVLITWLLFRGSKYNYAEIGVFILYLTSFFYIAVIVISLLKFVWPDLDTAYLEFPVLLAYNTISLVNFLDKDRKWLVVIKSIILLLTFFIFIQYLESYLVANLTS